MNKSTIVKITGVAMQNMKLCECGCGLPTPIAKYTYKKRGYIKGHPIKFISGHNIKLKYNPRKLKTTEEVFWDHVNICKTNECWEWKGLKDKNGYGIITINRKSFRSNRLAFIFSGGVLTEDKPFVLHHCDNPSCCNPKHLFAGSAKDNSQDMVDKGRHVNNKGSKHGMSKLTEEDVIEIKKLKNKMPQYKIASLYGVCQQTINNIFLNKTWTHVIID